MGPLRTLSLFALSGLVLVIINVWFATRVPWLRLTFESCSTGDGVCIKSVTHKGSAQGALVPGTRVMALSDGIRSVQANNLWIIDYPYELTRYTDLNSFVSQQLEFQALLKQPSLIAEMDNGNEVILDKRAFRPLSDLPLNFWLISTIGYGGFLISMGVWVFRTKNIAARLFALSGCGFLLLTLSIAHFSSRELVVESGFLPYLLRLERIGDFLLAYSLAALVGYYPNALTRTPIASVLILLMIILIFNDAVQFYEFPFHAFMVPDFLIPFVFCIIFAILQWQRSRTNPVNRAIFRWFLLSLFPGSCSVLILEYMPPLVGAPPSTPLWLEFAAILMFYMGIALGISKYRLFDLDDWWLDIWLWLMGGLAIFGLDLLVISSLGSRVGEALWLTIVTIAWCYFPLRQWLWKYFVRDNPQTTETYLTQLNALFAYPIGNRELNTHWRCLLQQVFDPLKITLTSELLTLSEIRQDGFQLAVPGIQGAEILILMGRNRSRRLFTQADQRLAEVLLELAKKNLSLQKSYLESVRAERVRILRDLHDDVAAPLMMLTHRAETLEYRQLAGTALSALRETVYGLQQPEPTLLADVMADWRAEVRERLEAAKVILLWEECSPSDITLTPHERLNLSRVLREAVSNILHHAQSSKVNINCEIENRCLRLVIVNDGAGSEPLNWVKHTGLVSMQGRVTEMGGKIAWHSCQNKGTQIEVVVPLRSLNYDIPLGLETSI